ncbi:ABC transporter ATP-binding protein [Erysipelothrix inopinata]|uniref:ABC transporter ATP-binding protein n=1 Tax=Erysipelothrix inopinata TaxID=225084 RepID=A0A7G9RWZ4_9FIRM|nr:ABC transporter ATP-binding protein [Erysipelothrix inopinata]QNN60119.1 ABC transporter ATP-binding protein [Erysipelothrix inopinata]
MKLFYKHFKPEIPMAILGIIFVGSVAFIELYQIQLMAEIIDTGIAQQDFSIIMSVGLKMVGLALLGAVIAMLGLYFPSQVSNNFALSLREDVFKKIQTFSLKNMSNFQTASLVTRLTNDINFLQRTLMMALRLLVRAPVFLFSTVIMTYMISPELSWVMLAAVAFLSVVLAYIIHQGFPRFVKLQKKVDKLNRKVQESLMNIRVIKSFVREDLEDEKFVEENTENYDAAVSANNLMVIMNPALTAAIHFATLVIVWISAYLIVDVQSIHVGDLLVFINYLRFTMFSMFMITNVLMMVSRSKASIIRVREVMTTEPDITSKDSAIVLDDNVEGALAFNDVTFRYYEGANNVLENINFEVKPGEHIGIIGSTGSGKSTLINLMVRLLDVSEGSITLDGTDIRDIELHSLRRQFGFVPQKNVLFTGTIGDNLRLGNENASEETLIRATQAASIYGFIEDKEKGFDYPIQQGGSNLSGGQRQRMCIARALVMNPKVLVLDDSTSALDAATEAQVKESLSKMYSDITIISIAQKISSVADSDRILVLDEGLIVGMGVHEELLETCLVYQEIYNSQMKKGEIE